MLLQRGCYFAWRLRVWSDDFGIRTNLDDREDAANLARDQASRPRDEQDQDRGGRRRDSKREHAPSSNRQDRRQMRVHRLLCEQCDRMSKGGWRPAAPFRTEKPKCSRNLNRARNVIRANGQLFRRKRQDCSDFLLECPRG
jgi:NMD protein affecting ribosome stability and mRNA decay